jgi:hypothetical protein
MLNEIEADLAGKKLKAAERRRLRQRAELIRGLLTPRQSPIQVRRFGGIAPRLRGDGVTALGCGVY